MVVRCHGLSCPSRQRHQQDGPPRHPAQAQRGAADHHALHPMLAMLAADDQRTVTLVGHAGDHLMGITFEHQGLAVTAHGPDPRNRRVQRRPGRSAAGPAWHRWPPASARSDYRRAAHSLPTQRRRLPLHRHASTGRWSAGHDAGYRRRLPHSRSPRHGWRVPAIPAAMAPVSCAPCRATLPRKRRLARLWLREPKTIRSALASLPIAMIPSAGEGAARTVTSTFRAGPRKRVARPSSHSLISWSARSPGSWP